MDSILPVSVCMIAKNEGSRIERCLESLFSHGFEIVVVDTGSTDNTIEIAGKYTDKIYHFPWCDDFSAARNFSLSKASNDFIFMMDCDEWIRSIDVEEISYFINNLKENVGVVERFNVVKDASAPEGEKVTYVDRTERLFSRRLYHYEGLIHEQLRPIFGGNELPCLLLSTTIGHSGYDMTPEEKKAKSLRNLSLLLKELEQNSQDPYVYYQLGKAYEMVDDLDNAIEYYYKGLSFDNDPELAYVEAMFFRLGSDLLLSQRVEEALALTEFADDFPLSADIAYLFGCIFRETGNLEAALDQLLKALERPEHRTPGTNSYLAYELMAEIMNLQGDGETASYLFEKAAKCRKEEMLS